MTNCWSRPGTLSGIITLTGRNGRMRSPITFKEEIRLVWQSVTICLKTTVAWRKWSILYQKITSCYRLVHGKNGLFHAIVSFWIYNVPEITIRFARFTLIVSVIPLNRQTTTSAKAYKYWFWWTLLFYRRLQECFPRLACVNRPWPRLPR